MAINIEVKQRLTMLEARVSTLEALVKQAWDASVAEKAVKGPKKCPHCQEVPAYHFHVLNCPKKNKNGDDRRGNSDNS